MKRQASAETGTNAATETGTKIVSKTRTRDGHRDWHSGHRDRYGVG